jgi:hypothetical protein
MISSGRPWTSSGSRSTGHQTLTRREGTTEPWARKGLQGLRHHCWHRKRTCTICLETFVPGEQVVVTPCNHMFHPGCLTPWVKGHGNCPVCRSAPCQRRNVTAVNGNYSDVDLDLLETMRTMEEAFNRIRFSDFMSHR